MRSIVNFNAKWAFTKQADAIPAAIDSKWDFVNLPHSWNAIDGQDGDNDYFRGKAYYAKKIDKTELPEADRYFLEIRGANSYIGTLVDDLVTKGANEPYRMMTSRSEYRLVLRQDNADERLTPFGYQLGLISEERYQKFLRKQALKKEEIKRLQFTTISPSDALNEMLVSRETSPVTTGTRLIDLLKRPQLGYDCLAPFDSTRPDLEPNLFEQVEIEIKYEGYIQKQLKQVEQMKKLEKKQLPADFDYKQLNGLRLEAQEKLNKIKPLNIGQASRISGVSPADVSVLLIWLASKKES